MAAESAFARVSSSSSSSAASAATFSWETLPRNYNNKAPAQLLRFSTRASSIDDKKSVYKQLGLFSFKKKIEDAVLHAEMLAPTALELEEDTRIKQEELIRDSNLWDDPVRSSEILVKLADSAKVIDALKDLTFKAEEAKLITQLAEVDAINYGLFEQAYDASQNLNKFMQQYEMAKHLRGPYDMEGACMIIKARSGGTTHENEIWAEQLLTMYTKWAEKQGNKGRLVDKRSSMNGGIDAAIIEFEFKCAYGYLLGERGVHHMTSSPNEFLVNEGSSATVDIVPLFLGTVPDLEISKEDLIISFEENEITSKQIAHILHVPTGISFESSGERSHIANKIKALNRLKAKLLVIARDQGVPDISHIRRDSIDDLWKLEARRYVSHPHKLVHDVKTGLRLHDMNSVFDGNIEPLIGAHINYRLLK